MIENENEHEHESMVSDLREVLQELQRAQKSEFTGRIQAGDSFVPKHRYTRYVDYEYLNSYISSLQTQTVGGPSNIKMNPIQKSSINFKDLKNNASQRESVWVSATDGVFSSKVD